MLQIGQPDEVADAPTSGLHSTASDPFGTKAAPDVKLRSLAPRYEQSQHESYVCHLESAVEDPKNKNIALTGRYGTGKSSILDEFLARQSNKGQKTLRISINTLGPDGNEDLTNRIQKELVKQLVYRAAPGEVKRSRFARSKKPSRYRSLLDAGVSSIIVCGLLWFFGVRPNPDVLGDIHPAFPMAAFMALVAAAFWVARRLVGNRLVSQFSTGGASISFADPPDSYFDEYLDELVAFFEATQPDVVVFEDLDRFDDPRIFDSLRELNTLINASAAWKDKEHPLRFVYAIKDSLFEKLGSETGFEEPPGDPVQEESKEGLTESNSLSQRDAVEAEVERANRTKFFEIVIPVVPFLSHNNARDLLSAAVAELNMPEETRISRGLLDLVARHVTDMRLMINICNEFAVFAERLLWIPAQDRAPGMTADNLFAIVVYKNFHLADFEKLPRRASDLDALERVRRRLIRDAIAKLQGERRDAALNKRHLNQQKNLAQNLGNRLQTLLKATGSSISSITVGNQSFNPDSVQEASFWKTVVKNQNVSVYLHLNSGWSSQLSFAELSLICPECAEPYRWSDQAAEELSEQRSIIDKEVTWIRGANFQDLVNESRYQFNDESFEHHLTKILKSELARDLVRRGFVDRYYAEYSAAFYGSFLGVDVANFFRNSVWPNEMDIHAQFTTDNAVSNIIEQAPTGFTSSRSVLNIQIIDYLLDHLPARAKEVVAFIVTNQSEDIRAFLEAYFNDSSSFKVKLIAALAQYPWSGVFDHLALPEAVSDEDTRTELLDATLLAAHDTERYTLSEEARALIVDRHASLMAFTQEHDAARVAVVWSFAQRSDLIVPSLAPLSDGIRTVLVKEGAYTLTLSNLRTALHLEETAPPTLDRILKNEDVWLRCRDEIDTYLDAVTGDSSMVWAVDSASTLASVISEQSSEWNESQIQSLLALASPKASLPDLSAVPRTTWASVAESQRFIPNVTNLDSYSKEFGVDDPLAKILVSESGEPIEISGIDEASAVSLHDLTVTILNASSSLKAENRVQLALQLNPQRPLDSSSVTEIQPSGDDLLAHALESGLLPDTADTFTHFLIGGWASVSAAFKVSTSAEDFLTPSFIAGHVHELLTDPQVPDSLKVRVIQDLESYAADADTESATLSAAAAFAHAKQIRLKPACVRMVAPYSAVPEQILWQLATPEDEMSGQEIKYILGSLGGEYGGFNGETSHEFDVPVTASTKSVLDRLKRDELIELPSGGPRGRQKVRIL